MWRGRPLVGDANRTGGSALGRVRGQPIWTRGDSSLRPKAPGATTSTGTDIDGDESKPERGAVMALLTADNAT